MGARYMTEMEARAEIVLKLRALADQVDRGEGFAAVSLQHDKRRNEADSMRFDTYTLQLVTVP